MFKSSLLKYLKISMDISVASSLHSNKITAGKRLQNPKSLKTELTSAPLCKLALVTTHITKLRGLQLWKDDKTLNKTHVEHHGICTH